MALLEVDRATKLYGGEGTPVAALRDVSLEVQAGEFVALTGRSGCGKSTLLNLCGAVDFPTSGEVRIEGQSTTELDDTGLARLRREKIGFVFQSFQLLHTLTAVENVELPLLLAGKTRTRSIALERLRWVGLDSLASRLPHQLSGGQQQRVALARALVHEPRLLLADEPTGNLDSATGDLVLDLLRESASRLNVAVVMATHNRESTANVDRIITMRDGQVETAAVGR